MTTSCEAIPAVSSAATIGYAMPFCAAPTGELAAGGRKNKPRRDREHISRRNQALLHLQHRQITRQHATAAAASFRAAVTGRTGSRIQLLNRSEQIRASGAARVQTRRAEIRQQLAELQLIDNSLDEIIDLARCGMSGRSRGTRVSVVRRPGVHGDPGEGWQDPGRVHCLAAAPGVDGNQRELTRRR